MTILLALLLSISLMTQTGGAIASEHEPHSIPSYSGFAEIQATKNYFLIVGDTQAVTIPLFSKSCASNPMRRLWSLTH